MVVQDAQPEKQEKQAVAWGLPTKPVAQLLQEAALLTGDVQEEQATLQGSQPSVVPE